MLKNDVAQTTQRRITVNEIKEKVAKAHGLTVKEIDQKRREKRLVAPRQIAMYIATELTGFSLPTIAREFGKLDHTTVMYARDKVKAQMEIDEAYRNKVRSLVGLCQSDRPRAARRAQSTYGSRSYAAARRPKGRPFFMSRAPRRGPIFCPRGRLHRASFGGWIKVEPHAWM